MFQFLSRQPLAIVGALGLIGAFKGFLTLHEDVLQIVEAYQTVTFYIWDLLFGWINIIDFSIPVLIKQYLILGVIHFSASTKAFQLMKINAKLLFKSRKEIIKYIIYGIGFILIWPVYYFLYFIYRNQTKHLERVATDSFYYLETTQNMKTNDKNTLVQKLKKHKNIKNQQTVFFDFLCWALALILLSYGLLFFKG